MHWRVWPALSGEALPVRDLILERNAARVVAILENGHVPLGHLYSKPSEGAATDRALAYLIESGRVEVVVFNEKAQAAPRIGEGDRALGSSHATIEESSSFALYRQRHAISEELHRRTESAEAGLGGQPEKCESA